MPPLPTAGLDPWDQALNDWLIALEARITTVEEQKTSTSTPYRYSPTTTPPPGNNFLRLNATPATATVLWLSNLNANGADVRAFLQAIVAGARIYIQDTTNADNAYDYTVSGPPVDYGTYFEYPVAVSQGTGSFPTTGNKTVTVVIQQ
jgi:hypothetical protein